MRRDEERRVEQDEPRRELRVAGRKLECEPASERVADKHPRRQPNGLDDRVQVVGDAPRRLVRRRAVPEQIRRDDVESGQRLGESREVPPMARHPV